MGIFKQTIGTLTVSSTTQLTLVGRTVVRLGGLFKVLNSPTLSTAVSGIGGLDTGTIAASTFYYVYAVSNGTAHGIVASTSNQFPTGFTRYKKVGAFYTDSGSLIFKAHKLGDINQITLTAAISSAGGVSSDYPSGWISSASGGAPKTITYSSNIFSIAPVPVVVAYLAGAAPLETTFALSSFSLTNCVVGLMRNGSGSAYENKGMNLTVQKVGVDAIQPDWKDY
jgi:hypothetical protein